MMSQLATDTLVHASMKHSWCLGKFETNGDYNYKDKIESPSPLPGMQRIGCFFKEIFLKLTARPSIIP
jgi:hypothetical protein